MKVYFFLGLVLLAGLVLWLSRSTRWDRAVSLLDYSYKFNKKKINENKEIDCSGYVSYIVGMNLGSWELVEKAENVFATPHLTEAMFQDGTLVAYDNGDNGWDRGRRNGVNHVGLVLEHAGHLYMCESAFHLDGVAVRPLREALKDWNSIASKHHFGDSYLDQTEFKTKQFYVGRI